MNKILNILITGANGGLGGEFKHLSNLHEDKKLYFTDKDSLDITKKKDILDFVIKNKIDTIINCAAYTLVDKAQLEKEKAYEINSHGVENLATISKDLGIKLVHISTDYVFDGKNYKPYKEDDKTNPISTYGASKLAGEQKLIQINPKNSMIIRTSWLYSKNGANFVKTIIKIAREKESISVVYDQVGAPTYAHDLAKSILEIINKFESKNTQIYHYQNEGAISWFDFAKEIAKMTKINTKINPILSHEYKTPTPRPHFSVLDTRKIKQEFGIEIPYWKDSLDCYLREIGERA